MPVPPQFPRICRSRASTLPHRPVVRAACGMRFNFIRRPPKDIDVPSIGFPSRYARSKMLVGVSNPPIVFFFEGIFRRVGIGIPNLPKVLDKLVALLVRPEFEKRLPLGRRNDVGCVLLQPIASAIAYFLGSLLGLLFFFLRIPAVDLRLRRLLWIGLECAEDSYQGRKEYPERNPHESLR